MADDTQYFYRYTHVSYGIFDSDGDYIGSGKSGLMLDKFPVIRETDCGTWIDIGRPKWIKTNALKHWACHSKEAALDSFIARTEKHISIYEARLPKLKEGLTRAYAMLPTDPFQEALEQEPPF